MKENLAIQEKLYDFLLYIYPVVTHYPKFEKFTLQTRTLNSILDIMDYVEKANKSTSKKSAMYDADICLARLRRLIRLAKDLKYMSLHRYGVICEKITEIGKMLGGWIKWAQGS